MRFRREGELRIPILSEDVLPESLKHTPLNDLHLELGAKMVPFAGYDMPVQYPMGILGEHQHTRSGAGLFDVSHMGQFRITAPSYDAAAAAVEKLCPNDFRSLKPGQQRYGFLTNGKGGILDDLMVTRDGETLRMVVNAACKDADFSHIAGNLPADCRIERLDDFALLALQGPKAGAVVARLAPASAKMTFMTGAALEIAGAKCYATRSGYTGEDGFEISVPNGAAVAFARALLNEPEVKPIGLGARDSLRLEAGLCLYGSDITEKTTPVEAGLSWAIAERRRKEGGFPGDAMRRRWRVLGHDSRLAQVFDNIIANARSFSPQGGAVRVTLRPECGVDVSGQWREGYEILFDDDGPGIPQGAFERVFERFYTDRPEQGFGQNSGLGLSISRQIVEAHGGRIRALNRTAGCPEGTDAPPQEAAACEGPQDAVLGARFVVWLPAER